MEIWIDAQRSPHLVPWIEQTFSVQADSLKNLGMLSASDREVFFAARQASAVVMSKDADFVQLLDVHGPPPSIIWITCGNTSNARLKGLLTRSLPRALELVRQGEALVEISDRA